MNQDLLSQLLQFVKEASPVIWSVYVRQVYLTATAELTWMAALVTICLVLDRICRKAKKYLKEHYDEDWTVVVWVSTAGLVVCALIAFGLVISALMKFGNPDYYAIKFMLASVAGT